MTFTKKNKLARPLVRFISFLPHNVFSTRGSCLFFVSIAQETMQVFSCRIFKPNENREVITDVETKLEQVRPLTLQTCRFKKPSTSGITNYDAVRSGFVRRRSEVLYWLENPKNATIILY
jgi:hypothetical protein